MGAVSSSRPNLLRALRTVAVKDGYRPPPEAARSVLDGGARDAKLGWVGGFGSGAVLEPPALVAGLDDVAMVGQAVEQRGRHFGVAKYARPFAEGEIGRYDYRRLLIEAADQVEQQLPACLRERQIAELVDDDEVLAAKIVGQASLTSRACFGFQLVDQIDDIEEPASGTATNAGASDCDGEIISAGAGYADQHDVALMRQEVAADEVAYPVSLTGVPPKRKPLVTLRKITLGRRCRSETLLV